MKIKNKKKGIFISIDGSDGSGKSTQIKLLSEKLERIGFDFEIIKFPQYGKKSAGLAEEYLNGKYGTADEVGPYVSSIFFTVDRFDAKGKIEKWLNEGKTVISDRYVSANMGHQGGKIKNEEERKSFFNWLYNLEYKIFRVPKPDINIILDVSPEISQRLLSTLNKKSYLEKQTRDIHESNEEHLINTANIYKELGESFDDFMLINCSPNNILLTPEKIGHKIWELVLPYFEEEEEEEIYSPDFINKQNLSELDSPGILKVEKIFDNSKLPTRSYTDDAGLDLYSAETRTIYPGESVVLRTGLKMAIPKGYVGLVWDKSGVAKSGLKTMGGVIDAGYRGEVSINILNTGHKIHTIEIGQKIAQLLIQKIEIPLILESKLDDKTDRGENAYGSTNL